MTPARCSLVIASLLATACHRNEPAQERESPPVIADARPPVGTDRCNGFIAFVFEHCGIGKDDDPFVNPLAKEQNDKRLQTELVKACRAGNRPYDEGLIACFEGAAGDCAKYRACADGVVQRRHGSDH